MSSSTLKLLMIFALFIILVGHGSTAAPASAPTPPSALPFYEQACHTLFPVDYKQCMQTLGSNSEIASAKNLYTLSIRIMEAGLSNANTTKTYIDQSLKDHNLNTSSYYNTLKDCRTGYEYAIGCFKSALGEVKEKEYYTATYDLFLASTDAVGWCTNAVARNKIRDPRLVRGNQAAEIFGRSAYTVVDKMDSA